MIIYKTTNLINNKIYIGKDSTNDPKYLGSGIIFKQAIIKYGKNNFKKEILQVCKTQEELNDAEIYWINELNSRNKTIGYNIALGGDGQKQGTKLTEETKLKIGKAHTLEGYIKRLGKEEGTKMYNQKIYKQSIAQINRFKDQTEKDKVVNYGKNNGMYGKKHNIKTLEKISKSNTGKKHKPETIKLYKQTRCDKNNGMYNKGYLLFGKNNGRAKIWKIISPDNIEYLNHGELDTFCKTYNLSLMLFRLYKNNTVPKDLKLRGKNKPDYIFKLNTLGWSIYEL